MANLKLELFANPIWHTLQSHHRRFALSIGEACRYPSDVAPFAAVEVPTRSAFRQLAQLLAPGETVSVVADSVPSKCDLRVIDTISVIQMVLPMGVQPHGGSPCDLSILDATRGEDMLALAGHTLPDYFRRRSHERGTFYGIRSEQQLIAMAGERLMIDRHVEISAGCTHPRHRGIGYASALIWQLVRQHRRHGFGSWLHVGAANRSAIALYRHMGFTTCNTFVLQKVMRA